MPGLRSPGSARLDMTLTLTPLKDIPLIRQNDDLADIIINSLDRSNIVLEDKDIFVIAQKVVSKAEGRIVNLATVIQVSVRLNSALKSKKMRGLLNSSCGKVNRLCGRGREQSSLNINSDLSAPTPALTIPTSPVKENLFCFFQRIPINPQVKSVQR